MREGSESWRRRLEPAGARMRRPARGPVKARVRRHPATCPVAPRSDDAGEHAAGPDGGADPAGRDRGHALRVPDERAGCAGGAGGAAGTARADRPRCALRAAHGRGRFS
eukprot:5962864-Prymnesium_polylepis.1